MNKSALKKYAPQARLDFIAAVTRRAEQLGLNPQNPANIEKQGEALLINGRAFPAAFAKMRSTLEARIRDQGFDQTMDAMAYTWFNRLVAIRYMELHGFLDHGYRVLSHPANAADGRGTGHTQPEILDHIAELELPGLDRSRALDLKLAGNRDEELYREVLLAQCHALHKAMPFLFESLDDATELLLPDGLLRTDSILGKLVTAIDEADWQDVEIIGWLYQFYISEKKDQVIGKVVKSEDIPAATQLFTPNWIVKYLVQNSLGRLWLMANPTSQLATQWEYYIQPAEQTPEVNAQLDALIQARIDEDGATLNPESLTLLDPACGSGHILVEAYDLLRDIYLERGYRRQDIPRLILEKNLYGLDIDDRAAQLAGFALLMKARADDRRLFGQPVALNVLALQQAKEGSAAELHSALNAPPIDAATVSQLVQTFEQAKTFGSLIEVPRDLASALPDLRRELVAVRDGGDMLGRDAAETLLRLVAQAEVLAKKFDAVVANPPYMGSRNMSSELKAFLNATCSIAKADLYSAFIDRAGGLVHCRSGFIAMVVMETWMFLSTYEKFRDTLLNNNTLSSVLHMPYEGKGKTSMGINFGTCAFSMLASRVQGVCGDYQCLHHYEIDEHGKPRKFPTSNSKRSSVRQEDLAAVPGSPVAYWLTHRVRDIFQSSPSMSDRLSPKQGLATGDNDRFIRFWHEVDFDKIATSAASRTEAEASGCKWFPHLKGGDFRKWYGNIEYVVNWEDDGAELRDFKDERGKLRSRPQGVDGYFKACLTWSDVTSGDNSFRYSRAGFIPNVIAPVAYADERTIEVALAAANTDFFNYIIKALNPSIHFHIGYFSSLPYPLKLESADLGFVSELIDLSIRDWDTYECSWDFEKPKILESIQLGEGLPTSWERWRLSKSDEIDRAKELEERANAQFNECYELSQEDFPIPSSRPVSLVEPNAGHDSKALISYATGCMMGRYSLDAPGLIYAHAGNEGFDPSRYETFPADDDGIVPITDEAWFDDDGANRIREFVRVVWGEDTEAENMAWLAESLGQKASESADDTIRRYLSRDFYKDHLQTYKKRPIYWLFSSGKHKAFEALVYLHRYNAGTLSRMRMEYVVPLQSRMQSRIDSLEQDIHAATSSAETKRLQKQRDKLTKQLDELRHYDETLRHFADQRITLDLDDGVKVNYGKFGDLLAEVKAVTGNKG
jgi:hypothetical protein